MPGDHYTGRRFAHLVLVLGLINALGPMSTDTYLPAMPSLARSLDATDAQAQMTLSAMMFGIAIGQLIWGPVSDALGRRGPMLAGLAAHAVMSLACGLAPNVWVLLGGRFLQGFVASAIGVAVTALVRDLFRGIRAAELLSRLALVTGLAPIIAPLVGSALLIFMDWRGVFIFLGVSAVALFVLAFVAQPETLPAERRIPMTWSDSAAAYRAVLSDKVYLAVAFSAGMNFAALFAYVAGSTFVLQDIFGLSAQRFGVIFASLSLGLTLASQVNPRLVRMIGPVRALMVAQYLLITGGALALVFAHFRLFGAMGFVAPMVLVMTAMGFAFPNAPAIALHRHGATAGTAAALLGSAQCVMGALATPLVGLLADGTSRPVPIVILATSLLALAVLVPVRRRLGAHSFD